jgi:hypothetical protein
MRRSESERVLCAVKKRNRMRELPLGSIERRKREWDRVRSERSDRDGKHGWDT